ncbi:MAG: beta-eliminating lyase-related protein [Eubacteriales bacterium]
MIGFRCDYLEGCHPKILQALVESNEVQCNGYGSDSYCDSARERIRLACNSPQSQVHFIVGGTPANKTILAWLLKPWQGVFSAVTGHIATHETGAIEATGHKVLSLHHEEGKISAEQVEKYCKNYFSGANAEHEVEPGAVYLSQPTEFGTLYSLAELQEMRKVCNAYDLALFVDGARLGYALASPQNDVSLPNLAKLCDVFYIGGTKCGALCGEAVVIHPEMGGHFRNMMKQTSGILAKGRLLGVQFDTLFQQNLYVEICKNAVSHALAIAKAFEEAKIPLYIRSGTNQQFPVLNQLQMDYFLEKFSFEIWEPLEQGLTVVRFCTSWASKPEEVGILIDAISRCRASIGEDV